jgi:hypothetical protein
LICRHQKKEKPNKKFGNSSKYKFLCQDLVFPFGPQLCRGKVENFGQTLWDKSLVLLGTLWGTHEELGKHH